MNGWLTILAELSKIAARLRGVEIYHADAMDLIERFDGPETLLYIDPPYVLAARTARDAYKREMSDAAQKRLLDAILNVRGMVALSGYRNPLYDSALRSWERQEFEMTNN
jgi:DNA adenine methylase